MQRFVVSDLPRPALGALMIAVGALWLLIRALTTGLGGELGEFDVLAGALVIGLPLIALLGPRTIIIDESGIRVTRRGRVVLKRHLEEIVGVRGLGLASRLVFRDGTWLLWFTTGPDWGPATDFIVERVGRTAVAGALSLPAHSICFPPQCLGCGAEPEVEVAITARRGIDLLLWSYSEERSIPAPGCYSCRRDRRGLGVLFGFGPLVALVACLFLPFFTPLRGTPVGVLAGLMLVLLLALRNCGEELADWLIWRVQGRLAADGAVRLRFRDASREAAVKAASRGEPD